MRFSWSDPRLRNVVWQALIFGIVLLIGWMLVSNTRRNLAVRHIATGFGFLHQAASIPIGESLLPYTASVDTYGWALLIGLLNTLKISIIGIVLATVIGTIIGIGRLSSNWLVARLTAIYVETLRDIPLLLQLLFWYGIIQNLPSPRGALHPMAGVFLSNRGLKLPWLEWTNSILGGFCGLLIALGIAIWLDRRADLRQERTGVRGRLWPIALPLMVALPVLFWLAAGAELSFSVPELEGFNFSGGLSLTPEYVTLLLGLVTYTSSYIAEIVRSGIQAVPQGQWEAAGALGLRRSVVLRRIVLPQALRVIIPPMTSQYLNLTKNSSLAIAIGYQDIVSIANTTLNQTGQAIEGVEIIMGVFLVISLGISLFMNWYNARIALVER